MPPFFGQAHFHSALQIEAVPVLEQLAANDSLRDRVLNRFERDDPPPYESSTESEEFEDEFPIRRSDGRLPEDATAVMDPPLTDAEIRSLAFELDMIMSPAFAYSKEVGYENVRLRNYRPFLINPLFWGKNSERRTRVLIRHFIKRRWEKLGVWNPEWGIPVRKKQPNDNMSRWRWRWEQDDTGSPESETGYSSYRKLLVQRLLQLRQNLHRGETSPVVPRSHLAQDATASEAESFIISRPWVTFEIEWREEETRFMRALAADLPSLAQHIPLKQVIEWWKERGDWREKFNLPNGNTMVGVWKWRHESPSPEPDDLTPIDDMKDSLLDARDMDFTPSEIDALEAIPPPGYLSPVAPAAPAEGEPHPYQAFLDRVEYTGIFDPRTPEEVPTEDHQDTSPEAEGQRLEQEQAAEEQPLEQRRTVSSAPSQNTRFQLRRQLRDKGMSTVQDQNHDRPPPPRRSARIAGMKRSAESMSSENAPNKKRKGKAISRAAALKAQPVMQETRSRTRTQPNPAIPRPNEEIGTRPRRGRGRPRKEDRSGRAVTTELRAPARRRGKGMATGPLAAPRRGRRTGKNE